MYKTLFILLLLSGFQLSGCQVMNDLGDSDDGGSQSGDSGQPIADSGFTLGDGGASSPPDSGNIALNDGGGSNDGGGEGEDGGSDQETDAGEQIQCSNDLPFEGCVVDCSSGTCDPTGTEFYVAWQCFIQDEANFSCTTDDDCAVIDAPWFECDGLSSGLFTKSGLAVNRDSQTRANNLVSRYGSPECLELRQAYAPSQNLPDGGRASGARCNFDSVANVGRCFVSFEECYDPCGVECDGGS